VSGASIRSRGGLAAFGLLGVVSAACVPARGGWDSEAVRRAVPGIAALEGERLGDMVPVPALAITAESGEVEGVSLVACRFAEDAPIRIHAAGPGWSEEVGGKVLAALTEEARSFGLTLERVSAPPAEIEIEALLFEGAEAPDGLGDALVECDVGRDVAAGTRAEIGDDEGGRGESALAGEAQDLVRGDVRGRVRRASIRMRRSGIDAAGRMRRSSDEEWTGALLHELAHGLGFAGHAATGDSILVRDQSKLRRIGRAISRGEPFSDSTLTALYRLDSGQHLGERRLGEPELDWIRAIRRFDRERIAAGIRRVAVIASAGDREARWWICYADGSRLGLRFPGWADRLRTGRRLLVWPDPDLRAAIAAGGGGRGESQVEQVP
jgi:hypothetical protein